MKASAMSMVGFPLLLIPLAIYNIIAFLMPSVSFAEPLVRLKLVSGVEWPITLSDVMLSLGILLLLHEVIKGARPGGKYLTDHLLSLIVFGGSAAEFVLWPKFGTSTYFLLVLLAMVDFFSGIALRAQRGAKAPAVPGPVSRREEKEVAKEPDAPPAEEPQIIEPVPAPAAHQASSVTPVAESVLMDHPEPKVAPHPVSEPVQVTPSAPTPAPTSEPSAVTESEPSPQIPSPELQPGSETPAAPEAPQR
jgi:hypothetical protein